MVGVRQVLHPPHARPHRRPRPHIPPTSIQVAVLALLEQAPHTLGHFFRGQDLDDAVARLLAAPHVDAVPSFDVVVQDLFQVRQQLQLPDLDEVSRVGRRHEGRPGLGLRLFVR